LNINRHGLAAPLSLSVSRLHRWRALVRKREPIVVEHEPTASLGQFRYQTDGFRENNDLTQDIYNVFAQGSLSPTFSVQAEYRHRELEHDELNFNFDLFDLEELELRFRRNLRTDTARIGAHYAPTLRSDFIASVIYHSIIKFFLLDFLFSL
jgi:hypothetical protein